MALWIDPRYYNTLIDANVLDAKIGADAAIVGEILDLAMDGVISLMLPYSVKDEIDHPNTPVHVRECAQGLIYTIPVGLTESERQLHRKVLALVQGKAKPGRHERDTLHMVEAHKYGGGFFLTYDERLLKKAAEIRSLLPQMLIVTPTEFLEIYRRFEQKGR